jgi:transcriptional regulator with XRE-family HTH domain
MYPNLKAEMARKGVTVRDLSEMTGISYNTLAPKMRGDKPLKLTEALKIYKVLETDVSVPDLFEGAEE